jgi:hypothetical protein
MSTARPSSFPLLTTAAAVILLAILLLRWEISVQDEEVQDYGRHNRRLLLGLTGAAIVSLSIFATYVLWRALGC